MDRLLDTYPDAGLIVAVDNDGALRPDDLTLDNALKLTLNVGDVVIDAISFNERTPVSALTPALNEAPTARTPSL